MDELRKDLRSLFERQQVGLGEIGGSRETLINRALARKDEPLGGRPQLAAGIAAILIAALIVATFAYIRGRGVFHEGPYPGASSGRVATPTVPPTSKPARIPPGVAVIDVDLVDLSMGWVLLTTCVQPMTGTCHYSVAETTDGGAAWAKPVQVGGPFDPRDGDAPRTVHFVDRSDGFVYGHNIALVTHDGGHSWARINIQAVFIGFITGRNGIAWAATYPCAKGQSCSYEIRSTVDGGHTWSAPHELPIGLSPFEAVPFAASGLLMATSADLMITLDGGATWRTIKSACTAAVAQEQIATSDGHELWLLCTDGAKNDALYVSEDAGASWSQRALPPPGGPKSGLSGAAGLVSLAAGTALLNPGRGVMVSHDGGATWAAAGPADIQFLAIRFCSASDGWALDIQNTVWATSDGGRHWTRMAGIQVASA
jgi:photosystem II stability/assembly factor-like uncharacterized protein